MTFVYGLIIYLLGAIIIWAAYTYFLGCRSAVYEKRYGRHSFSYNHRYSNLKELRGIVVFFWPTMPPILVLYVIVLVISALSKRLRTFKIEEKLLEAGRKYGCWPTKE